MKTAKIITLIASAFFLLAAIGTFMQLPQFRAILDSVNPGNSIGVFVPPTIEIIFAIGSFMFWLYISRQEKKGLTVAHARLISIILIALSIALSWALTTWFILLPIYNLASTTN